MLGHRNQSASRLEFDSYSATRPVSDRLMSAAVLRTAWLAVVTAYGAGALCCLATTAWVYAQEGRAAFADLPRMLPRDLSPLGGWAAALACGASLLATWTALCLSASTILCGRMSLAVRLLAGALIGVMAWIIIVKCLVPADIGDFLSAAGCAALAVACLGGTALAFAAAFRRRLISSRSIWIATLAWLLLCMIWAVVWSLTTHPQAVSRPVLLHWLALPLLPGLLSLVLAPLATTPLALAWNRHR